MSSRLATLDPEMIERSRVFGLFIPKRSEETGKSKKNPLPGSMASWPDHPDEVEATELGGEIVHFIQ